MPTHGGTWTWEDMGSSGQLNYTVPSQFNTPPCENPARKLLEVQILELGTRDIHDQVPQMKEAHRLHGLGKEIGIVVNGGNKWYNNASLLNQFAHKIMTPVNMFGTRVVFGVIG